MTRGFSTRTNHSEFGPTLEFDKLPTLGGDRHAGSDRSWRRILTALAFFWLVVAIVAVIAVA
ncbi:MAG: hypothetical protein AB7E24_00375 [Novosphingobium sp.]